MKFLLSLAFVFLTSISFDVASKENFIKTHKNKFLQSKELNVKEFKAKFENTPNAILLDVRTPEEYSTGHLERAVNIDVKSDDFEKNLEKLDKNKTYFVYCKSGKRSQVASDKMSNAGFEKIFTLQGGILAWEENHFPVVK